MLNSRKYAVLRYLFSIVASVLLSHFLFFTSANSATYYFSTSLGNDARTSTEAQNVATPWKTIDKLNSIFSTLKAGDLILFKRSETFFGNIIVSKSGTAALPIIFGAFGEGTKPIISGFNTLSNWVEAGNGIFQTTCSTCVDGNNLVVMDGLQQRLGRFPNREYLYYESTVNNTAIVDKELNSSINWTGAELVIKKNRWIVDRLKITNHSGNTINYASGSSDYPIANFGYFIQNDIRTLDELGEWFIDPSNKKVSIFFGNESPTNKLIKAPGLNYLVSISSNNYITFQDLAFEGSNLSAFDLKAASNIVVSNCDVDYSGRNGFTLASSPNFSIQNSTINRCLSNALDLDISCSGAKIANNSINNTGLIPGMGKTGSGTYQGIMSFGANTIIEYNTIENTGYNGIYFGGNNSIVRFNTISNFCSVKDDGAGIYVGDYFVSTNKKIHNNVVFNGIGSPEGTNERNFYDVNGIYIDELSTSTDVYENSVFKNPNAGIYIHNANTINVNNNTFFDNDRQINVVEDNLSSKYLIRNISVLENVFFSKIPFQLNSNYSSVGNDFASFGTSDKNYYVRPYNDNITITSKHLVGTKSFLNSYTLEDWKAQQKKDQNSFKSPKTLNYYTVKQLIGTNMLTGGDFSANVYNAYFYSEDNNGSISWDNSGKIDGGSLKVSYSSTSTTTNDVNVGITKLPAITTDKNYILKFTTVANLKDRNIGVYLQQSNSPYNLLTPVTYVKVPQARKEHEILFSYPTAETNLNLIFKLNDGDGTMWFDNIQLFEADVKIANPADSILHLYNTTKSNKSFSLNGDYVDSKSKFYTGSVNLLPYTSIVLIKELNNNINPDAPVLIADDVANTLSVSHALGNTEILVSTNGSAFVAYTGIISVGDVSRPAGYWQFKIRSATGRNESAVVLSPEFTANGTPTAPVLIADDVANTLSVSHALGNTEILVSTNGSAFVAYTGVISVGDVARPAGYWQFKIRSATGRNESAVVLSPEFTANGTPTAPVLIADDAANTLSVSHALGNTEILVSTNGSAFVAYAGVISVGDVSRPAGYWQFKTRSATGRNESAVVLSPEFTANGTPTAPVLIADDAANTLSVSHALGNTEILVSTNGSAFVAYAGVISVGDVSRPAGYWQFKIRSATGRNESAVVLSPEFTANGTPTAPVLIADDVANTLSVSHALGNTEILVSTNGSAFVAYTGVISVGDVARPAGYWQFKIRSATGRNESAVVFSPAFTTNYTPPAPTLSANDVTNTLSASHVLGNSSILVSTNNASYLDYTGEIAVGDVDRPVGYWQFKIRSATGRNESAVVLSPAFTTNYTPPAPTLSANDVTNTLSASHVLGNSSILVSTNNASYLDYTGEIAVGDVDRPVGYWKFKTGLAPSRNESAVVLSPAFTANIVPNAPNIIADDQSNTISASHNLGNSEILVSVNGSEFTSYSGSIYVGDVARPAGYWQFKIRSAAGRNESVIVYSPAFTANVNPIAPVLVADDTANTLSASHALGNSEILVSTDGSAFVAYLGTITVGDVNRDAGYWKFKVRSTTGRNESAIVSSPAFKSNTVVSAPTIFADDLLNTISAIHILGNTEILVSTNGSAFVPYTGLIKVGDVTRPAGYWQFKIRASVGRNESAIVSSPAFTAFKIIADLYLYPNPTNSTLNLEHELSVKNDYFEIYSISGKKWLKVKLTPNTTVSSTDVSYFPPGSYILSLHINNRIISKVFVKN